MYVPARLTGRSEVAEDIYLLTYRLARPLRGVAPGRYVFVWMPGVKELPLSVYSYSGLDIGFIVEAVGEGTRRLTGMDVGGTVGIRGPYGRGFTISPGRRYMLVAGGIGAPPILYALREIRRAGGRAVYLFGARTASKVYMVGEAERYAEEVYISTDDGSAGRRGFVTDLAEEMVDGGFDAVLACGPDPMLRKLHELTRSRGIYYEASFTRMVKCGLGICGSCVLEPLGLRVCVDGPVFTGDQLRGGWYG